MLGVFDVLSYGYDAVGNRTSHRKCDGSVLAYVYDDMNRVIRKVVPERAGLTAAQTRDVHYDYGHALGLQTKARFDGLDGEGVSAWYDGFGRPVTTLIAMGGHYRYLEHSYDAAGNRTGFAFVNPGYVQFGFVYDGLGRMIQAHEHKPPGSLDDLIVRYWYNPMGSRQAAVRGANSGGFSTTWYRDALGRPEILANDLPWPGADLTVELAWNPASQIVRRSVSNDERAGRSGRGRRLRRPGAGAPRGRAYRPAGRRARAGRPAGRDRRRGRRRRPRRAGCLRFAGR